MKRVRTVWGDISPEQLGVCYAHEHVIIDSAFIAERYPDFRLDSVERASEELLRFKKDGGQAMVDSMPYGCGRNVHKLAEVSRRTEVHLLVPTGLHLAKYYPENHWSASIREEDLARHFIADIEEGIDDDDDDDGPQLKRSAYRAGLIKVATGGVGLDAREERIFAAAAKAHRHTGAPILTHTEQGEGGLEQVRFFQDREVDLSKVVLSHTDRKPDLEYHRKLLSTGVRVEYDSAFRWKGGTNPTLDLLVQLYPEFPDQLMLGMDAARRSYWKAYGGQPGLSYLLTHFRSAMNDRGLGDAAWEKIMVTNPASTYAMNESNRD